MHLQVVTPRHAIPCITERYTPLSMNAGVHEGLLAASIFLEVGATLCMKMTQTSIVWYAPMIGGYAASFSLFPHCLKKISLTIAYATWCGLGMLLTTFADALLFRTRISPLQFVGLVGIVCSTMLMHA
tara:strand:- start:460 stop:843 length:384 start_codon:yes stop_codon:yes gene_type:complete